MTRPGKSLVQDGTSGVELSFVSMGVEVDEFSRVEEVSLAVEVLFVIDLVSIARLDDLVVGLLTFVTTRMSNVFH